MLVSASGDAGAAIIGSLLLVVATLLVLLGVAEAVGLVVDHVVDVGADSELVLLHTH